MRTAGVELALPIFDGLPPMRQQYEVRWSSNLLLAEGGPASL